MSKIKPFEVSYYDYNYAGYIQYTLDDVDSLRSSYREIRHRVSYQRIDINENMLHCNKWINESIDSMYLIQFVDPKLDLVLIDGDNICTDGNHFLFVLRKRSNDNRRYTEDVMRNPFMHMNLFSYIIFFDEWSFDIEEAIDGLILPTICMNNF